MTFRNKVIVFSLLCILYLLFSTLYYIRASRSATIQDDDVIIDFDQHWRNALDDFPAQIPLEPLDEEPAYEQPQNEEEQVEVIETIEQQPKSEQPEQQHLSDEKYLTFFTHSGFQNQLIQVENGILLAWYLNRTLILPRALLGEAFGWSFFSKLQLEHTLRDPPRDESMTITDVCSEHAEELMFWDLRCPEPSRFVVMPFDEIFDLDWAKQHVRIVLRERSDFEWLEDKYGIKRAGEPDQMNGSYVDGDILFFKGGTRYDWRIFDTPRKNNRLYKYADSLDIFQLRERQEKLIHFSSLFGTGKLPIRRPEHYEFRRMLQRSITYKHPAVLALAEQVVNLLGGAGNYIGLHVRSGDGWFVKALPENVRSIVSQIGRVVESRQMSPPDVTPIDRYRLGLQQCLELSKTNNMTIVFMATDARFPRMNKAFAPLWNQYPCTFTIEDILPSDSPHWQILDAVKDPRTGGSLRKFLLPLVDASVAGRGWFFIGSEGSTFSGYIYRLHDVFWSDNEKQRLSQDASSSP